MGCCTLHGHNHNAVLIPFNFLFTGSFCFRPVLFMALPFGNLEESIFGVAFHKSKGSICVRTGTPCMQALQLITPPEGSSDSLAGLPHGAAGRLGRRACRAAAKRAKTTAARRLLLLPAPHMKHGGRACWRLAGVVAAWSRRYDIQLGQPRHTATHPNAPKEEPAAAGCCGCPKVPNPPPCCAAAPKPAGWPKVGWPGEAPNPDGCPKPPA